MAPSRRAVPGATPPCWAAHWTCALRVATPGRRTRGFAAVLTRWPLRPWYDVAPQVCSQAVTADGATAAVPGDLTMLSCDCSTVRFGEACVRNPFDPHAFVRDDPNLRPRRFRRGHPRSRPSPPATRLSMLHAATLRTRSARATLGALLATTVALAACATSTKASDAPSSSGGNGGGGGSGAILASGGATGSGTGTQATLSRCDDAGNCTACTLSIASLGQPAHYGANGLNSDSTQAFTDWLNAESANASVDIYTTRTTLTADFLKKYNVIIIQWLKDSDSSPPWTFSDDEVAALKGWVNIGEDSSP